MADVLKLIAKDHLTDNVWSFQFEAHPAFTWIPGQYMQVELPHADPDKEGTERFFTVSAAPFTKHPQITTRITETTFKQALVNLPIGGELKLLAKPDGDFVWVDTDKPRVFVAAGIGVTPFHSIIAERTHNHESLNLTLFYANRGDSVAFKEEFDAIAAANPRFKIQYITGLVTAGRLGELLPDLKNSLVYVSGPEPMVEAIGAGLRKAGLTDDQLKEDFFPNYTEAQF